MKEEPAHMVERRVDTGKASLRTLAWAVASLLCSSHPARAQSPSTESPVQETATPAPDGQPKQEPPRRRRLRIDVQKHVERVLEAHGEMLRFETTVDVEGQSPEAMFQRYLRDFDLECGPTGGGAPSEVETRAVRPHMSPSADLATLAQMIIGKFKGKPKGPGRYYLYRVLRGDEVSYALREEKVPETWRQAVPGATFELIDTFHDLKTAAAAWRRLERGFEGPPSTASGAPPPPWVTANSRPPEY
jgi:hypothetical protein